LTELPQGLRDRIMLVGWKDICWALGVKSPKTAKRWVKEFDMPILRMYGKPTIIVRIFENWWLNHHKILSKRQKK